MKYFIKFLISIIVVLGMVGCGYSSGSLLPEGMDSIRVENFLNKIDPAKEVSDKRMSFYYRPGLETDITRGVIDAFIYDRHLAIESQAKADMLMKGSLVDIRQFPLSYDRNGDIEEFRVELRVDIELYDNHTGELMWQEKSFMGQSSYNVVGKSQKTAAEATNEAVKDLSRRIVERTVENW